MYFRRKRKKEKKKVGITGAMQHADNGKEAKLN
jgi:hypothetical protein